MLYIFTYCTNKDNVKLLEKTAQLKNIPLIVVYEPQTEYKGYINKIFKIREVIQNKNILDNDMILFVDAYDVLCFADSVQEIINKFHSYHCDLLIGAELNSYPYGYDDKYPPTPPSHCTNYKYINSGGFIGYKSAIMQLYSWKPDEEIIHICGDGGDQTYFIQYYLAHYLDKVKMDYKQKIFQNMFLVSWYDFIIQDGRLYNTILEQYPCFIHFNGLSYKTDTDANIMEIFVDKLEQSILSKSEIFDFTNYKKSTWPNPTIIPQLRIEIKLHILTYSTDINGTQLLEKSAKLKNIPLTIIYEPQSEYKGHQSKILKMREAIQYLPENDIILFVDAYDVLCFAGSEQEMIDKFDSYECGLLIGSEMNSFPDGYNDKYPPAEYNPTNYKYINSGGFIGYKYALMKLYLWKTDEEISNICSYGGDQHYFIQYYLQNHLSNSLKMDYNQTIFQNMYQVCWYDFVIKNGRLYNTILKQYPCFMHFSGNTYTTDTNSNLMFPLVDKLEESISNPEEVYTLTEYKRADWQHSLIPQLR